MRPDTGVQPNCTEKKRISSRHPHHRVVGHRVALERGEDAGRQTDAYGKQHCEERKLDRRGEERQKFVENGLVRRERRPEIPFRHLPDVLGVLHRERAVESELVQQAFAPSGIHPTLARQVLDRIARDEVNQRERKQRNADERRDDQCRAAEDEGEHCRRREIMNKFGALPLWLSPRLRTQALRGRLRPGPKFAL